MTEVLLCILILAILLCGAYYAAYRWIDLRFTRDKLTDELERAEEHIRELEERVTMLEMARDNQSITVKDSDGWDMVRG